MSCYPAGRVVNFRFGAMAVMGYSTTTAVPLAETISMPLD